MNEVLDGAKKSWSVGILHMGHLYLNHQFKEFVKLVNKEFRTYIIEMGLDYFCIKDNH